MERCCYGRIGHYKLLVLRLGSGRSIELHFRLPKGEIITAAEGDRNAHPTTINKGSIATAEVNQVEHAILHPLEHGVVARNPRVRQGEVVVGAAA